MPAALPAIGLITTLAGAGVSYYGQRQSAKAQEAMGEYNADVANNAAKQEAATAAENVKRKREQNQRQLSAMKARMAASGVNIGTGSSLDFIGDSAGELELQAMDIFSDSDARQRKFINQGNMSLYEGQQASAASNYSAMGSLLSGVGRAAAAYNDAAPRTSYNQTAPRTSVTAVR